MTPSKPTRAAIDGLAERVLTVMGSDNALDVLVEIALFEPDEDCVAVRPNAAGTKIIGTGPDGTETTHWAWDWTMEEHRETTAKLLRARAASEEADHG
jgi:hypothetical protein